MLAHTALCAGTLALCLTLAAQQEPAPGDPVAALAESIPPLLASFRAQGDDTPARLAIVIERFEALTDEQRRRFAGRSEAIDLCRAFRFARDAARSGRAANSLVALRSEIFGAASFETLQARIQVGYHLAVFGEPAEALEHLRPLSDELARCDDPRAAAERLQLDRARLSLQMDLRAFAAAAETAASVLERSRALGSYPENPALPEDIAGLALAEYRLGRAERSRDLYEESLTLVESALPADHPTVVSAMQRLAAVRGTLGDHPGAISLIRKVYEIRKQNLPAGHPTLVATTEYLGSALSNAGFYDEALELQRATLDHYVATLPASDPKVLEAKRNLATTLNHVKRCEEACALFGEVLEASEGRFSESDRHLPVLRMNYAISLRDCGRLDEAAAMGEAALQGLAALYPTDHYIVQGARVSLARTYEDAQRWDDAAAPAIECSRVTRNGLAQSGLALRPALELASARRDAFKLLMGILGGSRARGATMQRERECLEEALLLSETMRQTPLRVARRSLRARALEAGVAALQDRLAAAVREVERATTGGADAPDLERAVREKERIERLIHSQSTDGDDDLADVPALAAALPDGSVAMTLALHYRIPVVAHGSGQLSAEHFISGLVLHPDGRIDLVPICSLEAFESLDGQGPAARKAVRRLLLDPMLDAARGARTIFLSSHLGFEQTPLDALPSDQGGVVGDHVRVHRLESLFELLRTPSPTPGQGSRFLGIGGIDYAAEPGRNAIDEPESLALGASVDRGTARPEGFEPLPASLEEISAIGERFAARFEGEPTLLTDSRATEDRIVAVAPGATFLHIATHGFYDAASAQADESLRTLAPFALCGLAVTGANRGPDEQGRDPGILSAVEVQSLDLSGCHLAVLSACESALGVGREGIGAASLHTAFHGAGARFVISSLWRVGDQQTRLFMDDVYRNLWDRGMEPHEALWDAKRSARQRGAPFRDWAGWILTGR